MAKVTMHLHSLEITANGLRVTRFPSFDLLESYRRSRREKDIVNCKKRALIWGCPLLALSIFNASHVYKSKV